jgi:hypothetical protein
VGDENIDASRLRGQQAGVRGLVVVHFPRGFDEPEEGHPLRRDLRHVPADDVVERAAAVHRDDVAAPGVQGREPFVIFVVTADEQQRGELVEGRAHALLQIRRRIEQPEEVALRGIFRVEAATGLVEPFGGGERAQIADLDDRIEPEPPAGLQHHHRAECVQHPAVDVTDKSDFHRLLSLS